MISLPEDDGFRGYYTCPIHPQGHPVPGLHDHTDPPAEKTNDDTDDNLSRRLQ